MPLLLLNPWVIGGLATMTGGFVGWSSGFFGSNSIKNLSWFVVVALFVLAAVALYLILG